MTECAWTSCGRRLGMLVPVVLFVLFPFFVMSEPANCAASSASNLFNSSPKLDGGTGGDEVRIVCRCADALMVDGCL